MLPAAVNRLVPFPLLDSSQQEAEYHAVLFRCCVAMSQSDDAAAGAAAEQSSLLPLESNPETLNYFLTLLGWDLDQYHFVDVYSTSDKDLLNLVPRPVLGLLFVQPSTTHETSGSTAGQGGSVAVAATAGKMEQDANIWHARQT
eukprot:scaffold3517_cov50-Cylindrotheca_fusiformis.AAC.1